ncbi:Alkylated DNA repair protein ALKBH8-like protein, partial [Cucurbita argyrosperma subsp. sororia]
MKGCDDRREMGEELDDEREILKQVFGDSSEDEDCEDQTVIGDSAYEGGHIRRWEQAKEIKGLWLCRSFLSPQQESSLLAAIRNEGWFMEASQNQAMRFGNLPTWAAELSDSIHEAVLSSNHMTDPLIVDRHIGVKIDCPLPSDILWREPLFDQMIANMYQPGEGICAHVDLMRFEDGIAIVSLESPCVMHFTRVDETSCDPTSKGEVDVSMSKVPIYLNPGSVVLLWGEARYLWKHEINRKPGFQMWEGQELTQGRRTSITLRKLCQVD